MANEQNLVSIGSRTTSEQRKIQSEGGKASGATRRRKRSLKQAADLYLSKPVTDTETWNKLSIDGIDPEDIDQQMAMIAGLTRKAIEGNPKAAAVIVDIIGKDDDKTEYDKPYELPARVVGRAFVDLNRNIQPNIAYVLEGGRGSLKSSFWSLKIIELIKNNPDVHACITRQVAGTLKDSVDRKSVV